MAKPPVNVTPPSPPCAATMPTHRGGVLGLVDRAKCYARDVDAVMSHDPAARSRLEVVLTYPGLHAIWAHRTAHALWQKKLPLAARLVSHASRFVTGVEIHPGATIGQGVFIDHGMGVVIGETATVGDGCILFKGVVLGGVSNQRGIRHPQLGKNVVVGSNACILGNIPVGDGARIGSGSVVVRPVPQEATVVGVPGRVAAKSGDRHAKFDATLDHASLPDPVAEMIRALRHDNEKLRARLEHLEHKLDVVREDEDDDDPHLLDASLATKDLPPQHGG